VHEALDHVNADVRTPCAAVPGGEERVQLVVALAHKLRRTRYDVMEEAEGFARALHDECACVWWWQGGIWNWREPVLY
jgi:hypothetical protein